MTDASGEQRYLLDNRKVEAGTRFEALSALFDPGTFRHMDKLGIAPGWRCWEVGAGGPNVPAWLAQRVGPDGYVVATDIDPSWLPDGADRGYDVLRHDVGVDAPPPGGPYDLIHARLVLVHVPRRDEALRTLVSALRPGGWLLIEDADTALQPLVCLDEYGPAQRLANRMRRAFRELLTQRGAELAYGRTLPRRLREAGLVDVRADGYFPVTSPETEVLERASVEHVRGLLVEQGLATDAEVDEHLANIASGTLDLALSPLISAWGRRP